MHVVQHSFGQGLQNGVKWTIFHEIQMRDGLIYYRNVRTMIKILGSLFASLLFELLKFLLRLVVKFGELPIFGAVVNVQIHQLSNITHRCAYMIQ